MHRKYSIVGALALGLVLLAAASAATGRAAEYSRATLPGLPSLDGSGKAATGGLVKTAENDAAPSGDDAAAAEARKRLKNELDGMRRGAKHGKEDSTQPAKGDDSKSGSLQPAKKKDDSKSASPRPAKKDDDPKSGSSQPAKKKAETKSASPQPAKTSKETAPETAEAPHAQPQKEPVPVIDPEINRAAGRLIVMRFNGNEPSDGGPKAIRALIHDGLIAGVIFGSDNVQSKGQLKELIKFLSPSGNGAKPIFAISEIGGAGGAFPHIKDFEAWPSERDVAAKGDPEYAYLTYRSLGTYLAGLGFNMNFGPAIGTEKVASDPSASFSDSPLQAGVFAKTFILGHRDDDIITVPLVDGSDIAVRALKTLLVSYPVMPIAVSITSAAPPFAPYDGLVRGPRFCFVAVSPANDATEVAGHFNHGCDVLVIDGGKESPAKIRDLIARGVADAIKSGALNLAALNASAERLSALRSPSSSSPLPFTTRTSQ